MRLNLNRKANFLLIWINLSNVYLIKDFGIIPYLHKNYVINSKILSFKNEKKNLYFGNYIVSSNLLTTGDITLNNVLENIFKINNSDELAKKKEELINSE